MPLPKTKAIALQRAPPAVARPAPPAPRAACNMRQVSEELERAPGPCRLKRYASAATVFVAPLCLLCSALVLLHRPVVLHVCRAVLVQSSPRYPAYPRSIQTAQRPYRPRAACPPAFLYHTVGVLPGAARHYCGAPCACVQPQHGLPTLRRRSAFCLL